jgi:hypothetical protein
MQNNLEISLQKNVLSVDKVSVFVNTIDKVQSFLVYYANESFWQIVSEIYFTLQVLKDFFKDIETKRKQLSELLHDLMEIQTFENFIKHIDLSQSLIVTNCLEVLQQIPIIHSFLQNIKDFFIENVKIVSILN